MRKNKIILPQIKSKPKYTIELDEDQIYSLGGWLKENAGNVLQTVGGAGAMLIPGAQGIGIGMMASGVGGIVGNAMADDSDTIDYSNENKMPRTVGKPNITPNVMSFAKGGKMKKVMDEWDNRQLNIGQSNKKVPHTKKGQKQAIAIALSYKDKKALGGLTNTPKTNRSIVTYTKSNWRPLTDLEFIQSTGIDKDEFFKTSPEERIKFIPNNMFKAMKGKKGSTANNGGMQYFQNIPMNTGTNISENGKITLRNPDLAYIKKNFPNHPVYAIGGEFDQEYSGNEKLMQLEGPKHEQGGIQFTPDAELEGGESVYKDVVNSDRIKITKEIASKYGLPKISINKTVADYSKVIEKNYKDRDLDPFAQTSKEMELNNLSKMSTELAEQFKQSNQYAIGGPRKKVNPLTLKDIFIDPTLNIVNSALGTKYGEPIDYTGQYTSDQYKDPSTPFKDFLDPNYLSADNILQRNRELYNNKINRSNYGLESRSRLNKYTIKDIPIRSNINSLENINNNTNNITLPDISSNLSYETPGDNMNIQPVLGSLVYNKQSNIKFSNPLDDPNSSLFNPIKSKENTLKELTTNKKSSNIGSSILGAVPLAISAFQTARTAKEGYDKVKLGRVHAEEYNPSFIDPKYQLDQVDDTFATANESMNQQSRTDYLRRRIQSATEEAKTKSGILGQVQGINTQMLNQAKKINQQSRYDADRTNLQMQMQEENINAANKGAYQTARDYQLNNLGTMVGEIGRDIKMESANKDWLQWQKDIIPSIYGDSMKFDWNTRKWSGTDSLPVSNTNILSDYTTKPWNAGNNEIDNSPLQLDYGIDDYYNRVNRNTNSNSLTRGMRYDRNSGSYLNR